MSSTLSLSSRVSCRRTSTSGLISLIESRALSAFDRPTSDWPWMIWRCRLDSSTTSNSTIPRVPTPAAARYMSTGEPSPPAPTASTLAFFSRFCPSIPTSGMMRWRLYRRTSSIDRSAAGSTRGGRDTGCSSCRPTAARTGACVRLDNSVTRARLPAGFGRADRSDVRTMVIATWGKSVRGCGSEGHLSRSCATRRRRPGRNHPWPGSRGTAPDPGLRSEADSGVRPGVLHATVQSEGLLLHDGRGLAGARAVLVPVAEGVPDLVVDDVLPVRGDVALVVGDGGGPAGQVDDRALAVSAGGVAAGPDPRTVGLHAARADQAHLEVVLRVRLLGGAHPLEGHPTAVAPGPRVGERRLDSLGERRAVDTDAVLDLHDEAAQRPGAVHRRAAVDEGERAGTLLAITLGADGLRRHARLGIPLRRCRPGAVR